MSGKTPSRLVHIGLGGNVGNVAASFTEALRELDQNPQIRTVRKSNLYKTPPWGDENQDWFLNACASLETSLAPLELLDVLKLTEKALKREKTRRWGPRTIDLDILTYGDEAYRHERLEIPHPRMLERGFVLLPLADIASSLTLNGKSLAEWLAATDTSDIKLVKQASDW